MNKNLRLLILWAIPCMVTIGRPAAQAQNAESWEAHKTALQDWAASIKSAKCTFSLSTFTNGEVRKDKHEEWKRLFQEHPNSTPLPNDSNSFYSYFWIADENRWRCDRNRLYPYTGFDFSQYLFDGERYLFFDEYFERAIITGEDKHPDFIKGLHSNLWLGLGTVDLIKSYLASGLTNFKTVKIDKVLGRKCVTFQSSDNKGTLDVSFDAQKPIILRIKEVYSPKPGYSSIIVYEWSDVRMVGSTPIPFGCKLETYDVKKGTTVWGQSVVFQMQSCELNKTLGRGFFENVLRVGTPVEDDAESPGRLSRIGGDFSSQSEQVRVGIPPPLEELGVKASGVPVGTK